MSEKKNKKSRGKGFGTVERRGNSYLGRWKVNGKQYNRKLDAKTKDEARKMLDEITAPFRLKNEKERNAALIARQESIDERLAEIEDAKPSLLLDDAFEAYKNSTSRSDTAAEARLRHCENWCKRLVAFLNERYPEIREVRHVTNEHARAFASDGYLDVCPATKNQALVFYRRMWNVFIGDEVRGVTMNPWDGVQKKQVQHISHRAMTLDEIKAVRSQCTGEMKKLFDVGLYTGQRLGDCALLKWDQIDFVKNVISVVPRKTARKTGKMVVIPIHKTLLKTLLETPSQMRFGFVLPDCARMYQADGASLSRRFGRACKKAGIDTLEAGQGGKNRNRVGFHSLRYTFVSTALNQGVSIAVIQAITGHSTVKMALHYFNVSNSALVEAVSMMPSLDDVKKEAPSSRLSEVLRLANELTDEEKAVVLKSIQPRQKVNLEILDVNVKAA